MSDKELIELAARAARIECEVIDFGDLGVFKGCKLNPEFTVVFNPLYDDGDCARMEAAVGIDVKWFEDRVICYKRADATDKFNLAGDYTLFASCNGDKNRARRLASTRCAAEIGRNM